MMHPDYIKYWQNQGYRFIETHSHYNNIYYSIYNEATDIRWVNVAIFFASKNETQYRYNKEWYSEKEIIRLIKLDLFK